MIHFDEKGQAQYVSQYARILHPNGLQIGNLAIAWNPTFGDPVVHVLAIHRDGEVIDVLEMNSFEVLRREDKLDEAVLDGTLTAVLSIPDLRVGDELEIAYTTRVDDPTLGNNDSGVLIFSGSPSPGRYRMGLKWIEGQKPTIKISKDIEQLAIHSDRGISFSFDNPSLLTPTKDAPGRFQLYRMIQYSDFKDWQSVSSNFERLFAQASRIDPNSPLRKEAARIAATHPGQFERAAAALKLVQQNVRYLYVGLDGGNYRPVGADATWERRYGDCKGKTALLLALLTELGVDAEVLLVTNSGNDDGMDERLPSPGMFNHVIVRARIDGKQYYLDGTLPAVAGPTTDPAIPYRWVLPLTALGSGLEKIEWKPFATPQEITLNEIDARAGFDEPARLTVTTILRGPKGLESQIQFSGVSQQELLTYAQQNMVGDYWKEIDKAEWHYDEAGQASVLTFSGTGTVDWEAEGKGRKSLVLPGGGFNPPEKRQRATGQDQDLPFYKTPTYDCDVTTVRVPEGTTPAQWTFNSAFDTRIFGLNYVRAFEFRDGAISMVRAVRTESPEIDASSARADNDRIDDFDNSKAVVYFNPRGKKGAVSRSKVPATYEFEWSSGNVSCVAADFNLQVP